MDDICLEGGIEAPGVGNRAILECLATGFVALYTESGMRSAIRSCSNDLSSVSLAFSQSLLQKLAQVPKADRSHRSNR